MLKNAIAYILKYFLQPWVAELINKDEQLKEKYKKSK